MSLPDVFDFRQRVESIPIIDKRIAFETIYVVCGRIGEVITEKYPSDLTCHPTGNKLTVTKAVYRPDLNNPQERDTWTFIKMLQGQQVNYSEIAQIKEEEYQVGSSGLKTFRVDIVGLSTEKKVAIECGNTPGEKIAALKMFFDDVIVLPYFTINTDQELYNKTIRELNEKIDTLQLALKQKEKEKQELASGHSDKTNLLKELFYISQNLFETSIELTSRYMIKEIAYSENYHQTNKDLIQQLRKRLDELESKLDAQNALGINFL